MVANRLDGLIFDLDGTLVDNFLITNDAFRAGFATAGHPAYTDAQLVALFGPTPEEIFREQAPDRWQEAIAVFYERYEALATAEQLVLKGMQDTLRAARKADIRLGIVTGSPERTVTLSLRMGGLTRPFSDVSPNTVPSQEKAERITAMAQRWGLPPHRVGYVGDTARDVVQSKAAGVVPLGAAWCRGVQAKALWAAGAAQVFTKPRQLQAWLLEPQGSNLFDMDPLAL